MPQQPLLEAPLHLSTALLSLSRLLSSGLKRWSFGPRTSTSVWLDICWMENEKRTHRDSLNLTLLAVLARKYDGFAASRIKLAPYRCTMESINKQVLFESTNLIPVHLTITCSVLQLQDILIFVKQCKINTKSLAEHERKVCIMDKNWEAKTTGKRFPL